MIRYMPTVNAVPLVTPKPTPLRVSSDAYCRRWHRVVVRGADGVAVYGPTRAEAERRGLALLARLRAPVTGFVRRSLHWSRPTARADL